MNLAERVGAVEARITPGRLKLIALAILGVNLATTVAWIATLNHGMDSFHQPLGGDFIIFYAVSSLTLKGKALLAFSAKALLAVERSAIAGAPPGLLWCYPPPFQLLIAPLSFVSFPAAYAAWTTFGVAAYLAVIRRIATHPWTLLFACAFPGLFAAAWQGQTSLFVLGALGLGLLLLDRRPWLAGAVLGLLVCKPQFALVLPLLLIGTGRWRSVFGAALSVIGLSTAAASLLGWPVFNTFLVNLPEVADSLAHGELPWAKIPSLFVALSWLGVPYAAALAIHGTVAVAVAITTLMAWRRPGPLPLKAALAVLATLIASPYSFNYDLALLAVPIAAIAEQGRRGALPRGAILVMALAAFGPNLLLGFAGRTHLQLTPALILLTFWMVRRVHDRAATSPALPRPDPSAFAPTWISGLRARVVRPSLAGPAEAPAD